MLWIRRWVDGWILRFLLAPCRRASRIETERPPKNRHACLGSRSRIAVLLCFLIIVGIGPLLRVIIITHQSTRLHHRTTTIDWFFIFLPTSLLVLRKLYQTRLAVTDALWRERDNHFPKIRGIFCLFAPGRYARCHGWGEQWNGMKNEKWSGMQDLVRSGLVAGLILRRYHGLWLRDDGAKLHDCWLSTIGFWYILVRFW